MTEPEPARSGLALPAGAATVVGLLLGFALGGTPLLLHAQPAVGSQVPAGSRQCVGPTCWGVQDANGELGSAYSPGSIQAWGSNSTDLFVGGNGYFNQFGARNWSSPRLLDIPWGPNGWGPARNATPAILPYFHGGGIFGQVWNGSGWLFSGFHVTADNRTGPSLIQVEGSHVTDLGPKIAGPFAGAGIWAAAWNGSAWLLGGASSGGPALAVLWPNGSVSDLSAQLRDPVPGDWVQLLAWNGTAWLVGGFHLFGELRGVEYVDRLAGSPFSAHAPFAAGWDGTRWLVGGSDGFLVYFQGGRFGASVALAPHFNAWVSEIDPWHGGWIISGGGYAPSGPGNPGNYANTPALEYVAPNGTVGDLSSSLPESFAGGYVQFGAPFGGPAPMGGSGEAGWVLVGEGAAVRGTQTSHGAIAFLYTVPRASGR